MDPNKMLRCNLRLLRFLLHRWQKTRHGDPQVVASMKMIHKLEF